MWSGCQQWIPSKYSEDHKGHFITCAKRAEGG